MDNKFPRQLFPHVYLNGPPDLKSVHDYGSWGSYESVVEIRGESARGDPEEAKQWEFLSQHKVEGERWIPTEPIVTPLLAPNKDCKIYSGPPSNPDDFPEHMQYFYVHHCMDSFFTMGQLLGEHFNFRKKSLKNVVNMSQMKNFLGSLNYKKCELGHYSERVCRYHHLLGDVISDIPQTLLAELLHEELTLQKELVQFQPVTTGGALVFAPLQEDQGEACLIYPRGEALDSLTFHRVVQEFSEGKPPSMHLAGTPMVFNVNGTVRQVSMNPVDDQDHIGVRSDYFCSSWVIKDGVRPRAMEVVQLKERSTSLSVSPHVTGELLVASESGAAYLWTLGKGLQKFREEDSNLYFNAKSPWRWCEFSAHPRVMVYADRTGAELTDTRSSDCSHTLFRIGNTSRCRSGERLILTKYLDQCHAHHHLFTTQFSAYLLDERMPGIPALKWEHMMESPPCFAQALPALGPHGTSKILLGAQRTQETMLLQYSGGREWPCRSDGPVQRLSSPCESLQVRQLPHRQHSATARLAAPATGLAVSQNGGFLTVFQLTEAGDVFYQLLELHPDAVSADPHPSARRLSAGPPELASNPERAPAESGSVGDEEPALSGEKQLPDGDFERECRAMQAFAHADANRSPGASGGSSCEPTFVPESSARSALISCARLARPGGPETASRKLKLIWKHWLESLLSNTKAKKRRLGHRQVKTEGLMSFNVRQRDELEEDKFLSLRKVLLDVVKNRKLLVHGDTYLPPLQVTPFPDAVHPEDWPDDLSRRLSASWEGGWSNWWVEKLGLNRDAKIEALRRKRRREKRARSRSRMSLSGSFVSSISYQDGLSDWSSVAEYLGSDAESFANSQNAPKDEALSDAETLAKSQRQSRELPSCETEPSKRPLRSPQLSSKGSPLGHTSPLSRFQASLTSQRTPQPLQWQASTVETDTAPAPSVFKSSGFPQQTPKRRQQQDYLSSLFGSQEPSQDLGQDDGAMAVHQRSSFSLAPWGLSKVQTSSQASQPQRKKSRMGF
ncbi:TATA box-binding protein-associated factor RNA polymerase I subunit C [Electrophorus electricus]|uniref:TATA box-binding protein-associated factor RNA polymerase I subunit C n=1 Tax=Electrophorus electricus TaxID=8005 RepID=A0A4W4E7J6_ELEEL|nr:TATA box-binding protein-associated factor RNA polymerase I subunit C [Electrophorus electricus]XP_035377184.1 TATA box-binding protein-associated factor RNA polymerase I subunit C [Electrophorus electricus]